MDAMDMYGDAPAGFFDPVPGEVLMDVPMDGHQLPEEPPPDPIDIVVDGDAAAALVEEDYADCADLLEKVGLTPDALKNHGPATSTRNGAATYFVTMADPAEDHGAAGMVKPGDISREELWNKVAGVFLESANRHGHEV